MDKVQKIRKVIEKRYEYWKEKESNSHSIESEIRMSECQHLLLMLDSLQEEPVSEDLCEVVSYLSKRYPEVSFAKLSRIVVRAAKWQKEQMMKDAMPATVFINQYGNKYVEGWSGLKQYDKFKNGEDVKLIIIKED